jgi:glycosyltransferase involved in cell wall biosynthesis
MRIQFDHQIFLAQRYGGISRYYCELADKLRNLNQQDDIRISAPWHINEHLAEISWHYGIKLPVKLQGIGPLMRPARWLLDFKAGAGWARPDIFHETYLSAHDNAPRGCKRLMTVLDMTYEKIPGIYSRQQEMMNIKAAAVRRADHVICISRSTQKDLIDIYDVPEAKTSVVYLAQSLKQIPAGQPLHNGPASPFLLYVGQRHTYKNFDRLVMAFARSTLLNNDFKLVCFGGSPFTAAERELLHKSGLSEQSVIHMPGDDAVLSDLYAHASAMVYPSLYEGFGIPLLEAMQFGCPVVCSNASSLPEVGGGAALYFDPHDAEDMAAKLEMAVSDQALATRLRAEGYVQLAKFSWLECARQTRQVYVQQLES